MGCSNVNPPVQACVSMAQGGTPCVETLMQVQSLLKEVRDNPDGCDPCARSAR